MIKKLTGTVRHRWSEQQTSQPTSCLSNDFRDGSSDDSSIIEASCQSFGQKSGIEIPFYSYDDLGQSGQKCAQDISLEAALG